MPTSAHPLELVYFKKYKTFKFISVYSENKAFDHLLKRNINHKKSLSNHYY